VVLYVLVCGALPFDGSTLQSLRDRVLSGRFRIPFFMSSECEHLIRRMLVLEPTRRYTIDQIKRHRWMCPELLEHVLIAKYNLGAERQAGLEPSEDILRIMAEYVGIGPDKTRASLKKNTYDHVAAIYLLLQDRVSHKKEQSNGSGSSSVSSSSSAAAASRMLYKSTKIEQQQPPPQQLQQQQQQSKTISTSSILAKDQAHKRLSRHQTVLMSERTAHAGATPTVPDPGQGSGYYAKYGPLQLPLPLPGHGHLTGYLNGGGAVAAVAEVDAAGIPLPLRYTPLPSAASPAPSNCSSTSSRVGRHSLSSSSPRSHRPVAISLSIDNNPSLANLRCREMMEPGPGAPGGGVGVPLVSKQLHQTISEYIIKQSTEDCRALLQQVSSIPLDSLSSLSPQPFHLQSTAVAEGKEEASKVETGATAAPPPASTTPTSSAAAPGPTSGSCPGDMNGKTMKTMSSSSSFDSKANLGQSFRYKMSAEASKLFQTLQESPLPVEVSGGEQGQATTLSSNL